MMKFDPTKHRFGMAYNIRGSYLCYPFCDLTGDRIYSVVGLKDCMPIKKEDLSRSTEYDLIPMSQVQPLLDALEAISDKGGGEWGSLSCSKCAEEALTTFKNRDTQ